MENIMIKMEELQIEIDELKKVSICSQIKDNFLYFINKKYKLLINGKYLRGRCKRDN